MPAGPLCWEEDILGTGSVMKRRLRKSASSVGPDYKQEVKVRFECWAVNRPEQRHIEENLSFIVGDMEVTPAMELAVKSMTIGESSLFQSECRFAYGDKGKLWPDARVEAGETVQFELELLSCGAQHQDPTSVSVEVKLATALDKKEKGNSYFKEGDLEKAIQMYKSALAQLVPPDAFLGGGEESPTAVSHRNLTRDTGNNLATCYMRHEEWSKAIEVLETVHVVAPDSVKCRCKLAEVHCRLGDYAAARAELSSLEQQATPLTEAEVKLVNGVKRRLKEARQGYKEKAKEVSQKMFQQKGPGPQAPPEKEKPTPPPFWWTTLVAAVGRVLADLAAVAIVIAVVYTLRHVMGNTEAAADTKPAAQL